MNDPTVWHHLAIALGIGFIVGLERGWKTREQHSGQRFAGLRTFSLTGLLGGVLGLLSAPDRFAILAAGTLVFGALVVAAYVISVREQRDFGMTTELALLTTLGLGATATLGMPFEAAAAAVVMALVLGLKTEFHAAVRHLERRELLATLQLLAIAAVLVPLLPDRQLGPWNSLNPRMIGLLVLLVAGISYVGYFAVRILGARLGLLLTALFGGLSSSTAVTVAYARRARDNTALRPVLGAGIALAAATMVPRLIVEIAAVDRTLLSALWPTFATLTLIPLGAVAVAARKRATSAGEMPLRNPLELGTALTFGVLLIALFIAAEGLQQTFGDRGAYTVAAIAAVVDVDAVSLAFAAAASNTTLEPRTAARAIALAVVINTVSKATLAATLGGPGMLRSASMVLATASVAGGIAAWATLR